MQARRAKANGRRTAICLALALLAAGVAQGQAAAAETQGPLAALHRGTLLVWVVRPEGAAARPKPAAVPAFRAPEPGYREATAGSFGQTAGSFGQTAGSYGIDSTSPAIGTPPSGQVTNAAGATQTLAPGYREATATTLAPTPGDRSVAAGSYGQTAGSFGQTAGSVGSTAGGYGQTAGSFGHSLSTLTQAGQPPRSPVSVQELQPALKAAFPDLGNLFVEVSADRVSSALQAAEGRKAYPDVLIFEGFPSTWAGPPQAVRDLQAASSGEIAAPGKTLQECVRLRQAPHPETARAFLAYLEQQGGWTVGAR